MNFNNVMCFDTFGAAGTQTSAGNHFAKTESGQSFASVSKRDIIPLRNRIPRGAEFVCASKTQLALVAMSIHDPISKITYEEYCLFPNDGNRHEVINGLHYMNPAPTPAHQSISSRLHYVLFSEIDIKKQGTVFHAPIDVQLGDHDIVQPDLIVVLKDGTANVTETRIVGPPDLVIEILSRSTAKNDFTIKRRLYEQSGVREYWIVDPDATRIEAWILRDGKFVEKGSAEKRITLAVKPDISISVTKIFES